MNKPLIHILGGGVCGLAAGLRLGQSGRYAPVILERETEPGGLARSLHFKGLSTDLGPHRIHTELPEVETLVSEICAPSLYTVKRKSRIFLRGHFLDYPPSPIEMSLRLGPHRMAHFGLSLLAQSLAPAVKPETYESLMRRAFGPALYDFMLRPYTAKVWKTDPAEIHADTARVRVSAGSLAKMIRGILTGEKKGSETSLREFRYVKGGAQTLVRHLAERALAAGAQLRLNSAVKKIELESKGEGDQKQYRATAIEVTNPTNGESEHIATGGVISTAPVNILVRDLLPPIPELAAARTAAEGLVYLNNLLVLIIVKRKVISGDNWLYFPDPDMIFNRAYESKSFDPAMGPEDKSVLCVEITTRPGDATDRMSDADLMKETIAQLTRTGLFRADEVEESLVHRLEYGYPLYSLDYHERLDTIFTGLRRISNLLSSGRQGLFNHNNTDHSIMMGLRSAEAWTHGDTRSPADHWYDRVEEFKHFRIVD